MMMETTWVHPGARVGCALNTEPESAPRSCPRGRPQPPPGWPGPPLLPAVRSAQPVQHLAHKTKNTGATAAASLAAPEHPKQPFHGQQLEQSYGLKAQVVKWPAMDPVQNATQCLMPLLQALLASQHSSHAGSRYEIAPSGKYQLPLQVCAFGRATSAKEVAAANGITGVGTLKAVHPQRQWHRPLHHQREEAGNAPHC